jgi:hypothetical protein
MRSCKSMSAVALLTLLALAGCSKPAGDSAANSSDQNPPATGNPSGGGAASSSAGEKARTPMAQQPVVVPAGTTLTVRLGEAVGSKISQSGQTFTATLASPVEVNGKTLIPSGAVARGLVVDAKPLGRFKGGAVLEVKLNSITVNGSEKSIETSAVTRTEKGKGKRTGVLAGGGAAFGAIIGGLAGGGKGAAIGALAGGGAGAGGAAFTGNKDIVLPAEAALSFKLESPLELK